MEHRKLGNSNLNLSALVLGCMGMSEFYCGQVDVESESTTYQTVEHVLFSFISRINSGSLSL
jgi:aryl-alcohol dehydrogenase-like predicted oxidoreductase